MPYPRFTEIIINHFISQNKSISMRNRINLHTARDISLLGTLKYVSKTEEHQVYGALIPKEMLNEDIMNSTAYKTYYFTIPVSPKEPTKKPAKDKKDVPSTKKPATKPKQTKKKAPVKADRGKGLNVLSEVALSEVAQLKEVTKRSKKDFHISHESGSGDGTDFESGVPDEQQRNISSTDEGTGTKLGVPDVPKYDSESKKESWVMVEKKMIMMNMILKMKVIMMSNEEYDEEEEEEYVDEFTHEEDDAVNAKEETEEELYDVEELYKDVNVNLRKEDVEEDSHVTLTAVHDTQKTEGPMQSSSVSSDFTNKLLNFENASPTDNEIASLMDTTVRHEEPSGQTSTLFTVPITIIPEITSTFTITIPTPHPLFNPLPQQTTPTPTPTASEVTTSFLALPDFASVFRFNERVTNLEKDLSEMKQVDHNAQAISSIPSIVNRYIDNKQGEAIQQAVKSHTAKSVSEFATPVIERNNKESLEAAVLAKSSSQPKSTYEAAASLSEFELTKILMDKMKEHKPYLRADYKRELYDALVKSYNTHKDLFDTYGEVFSLKRSREEKDKDHDPSAGSDRGTKRRKSSKDAESSRDPKSKESKSTSSSKGTSCSQHKSSGKSVHVEEPSHTIDDSGVRQNQEFNTGNNDEQPDDEAISKSDWYKKPEQPPTPDPDWNKRQHVDFRPSQTWIINIARAENPPTSFDELMDTPIDFSAFVIYDKHAYCGTSHWGSKRQKFYEFASNRMSSKDVYSRKRIIAVTSLKIMKWYDYGHFDEIKVRTEDQELYKFKEGDFPRLRLQDIEDMLLLLVQQKLTNLTIDERF
ncbi:hypothetical protein Tco_0775278, partial [Tanacetum coccineum]